MVIMADDNPEVSRCVKPAFTQVTEREILLGAEGPVFNKNGVFYMVAPEVEVEGKPAGQIVMVDLCTGNVKMVLAPTVDAYGGIPAGCQFDRNNELWVADMRLGILKVDVNHTFTQIAKVDSMGEIMQGCNDCTFDYEGNLWATAPAGKIAPYPYHRSFEKPFGSVYCLNKSGELIKVATGFYFPNGIAVQHTKDGAPKLLIVAETPKKKLWAFDIIGSGKVGNKRLWGKIPGDHEGGPDGMDFDCQGNLLVANWGASYLEVFGPNGGSPIARIRCPFAKASNLHFHPNSTEVYVTEHDNNCLWKFNWEHQGRREFVNL